MGDYMGTVKVLDVGGVNALAVSAAGAMKVDGSAVTQQVSSGGTSTMAIPAGTVTNTVIKGTAGRLCRILVTSLAGAAVTTIYDNATTNSGTIIGYIVAATVAGTMFDFQLPATNGITVGGAATNPAMTVSYM